MSSPLSSAVLQPQVHNAILPWWESCTNLCFLRLNLWVWEVTNNQSLEQNLQRSWKDIEKKKGPLYKTFSIGLFFTHLLTAKTCLETKLSLFQESFVSQENTRPVNRNVLWAVWYSDPCLNFIVKATVEADLSFLWFRWNRQSYICLNLCGSLTAHKRKFTIIPNCSLHVLDLLQFFPPRMLSTEWLEKRDVTSLASLEILHPVPGAFSVISEVIRTSTKLMRYLTFPFPVSLFEIM